jgi:histidinol-phosphate aminotransferase
MTEAVQGNWMYSDPENFELRDAIAALHGVSRDNVVIGEGIDGLLGCAVRLICAPGECVVMADGAYPTFAFHVAGQGGELNKVPFRDDREDLEGLLAATTASGARILYVSNPNNPMGTSWDGAALDALISRLPPQAVLLLDEAYSDTAPPGAVPAVDTFNPQVLRLRTFSKAYGLAGARIGYALGERGMIAAFEKVRNHYGINRIGQIGALAAVNDQPYLARVVAQIAAARERIAALALANGLQPIPSAANFVTIDCGRDGPFAKRVLDQLLSQDVFVRKPGIAPLDRCIRVSCGRSEDLDILEAELPAALKSAAKAQR